MSDARDIQKRIKRLSPMIDKPLTSRAKILQAMLMKRIVTASYIIDMTGLSRNLVTTNLSDMYKNCDYLDITRYGPKGSYRYELVDILCPMSKARSPQMKKEATTCFKIDTPFQRVFNMMGV